MNHILFEKYSEFNTQLSTMIGALIRCGFEEGYILSSIPKLMDSAAENHGFSSEELEQAIRVMAITNTIILLKGKIE